MIFDSFFNSFLPTLMGHNHLNDFDEPMRSKAKLLYHALYAESRAKLSVGGNADLRSLHTQPQEGHPLGMPLQRFIFSIHQFRRKSLKVDCSVGRDSYLDTETSILENRPTGCFGSSKMPDLRVWHIDVLSDVNRT